MRVGVVEGLGLSFLFLSFFLDLGMVMSVWGDKMGRIRRNPVRGERRMTGRTIMTERMQMNRE